MAPSHPSPFKSDAAAGAPELHGIVRLCAGSCSVPPSPPGECPAPSRPRSFPRKASPARVVAEPHCCSEAAEEKAPLNSGGRGPDPGARRKPRSDWGSSGMAVEAGCGHAAHF